MTRQKVNKETFDKKAPTQEIEFTYKSPKGNVDVDLKFTDGRIDADTTGFIDSSFRNCTLETIDGKDVLTLGIYENQSIHMMVDNFDTLVQKFDTHVEAHEQYEAEAEEWIEAQDFEFTVVEKEFEAGVDMTMKYTENVLVANKSESDRTDEEQTKFEKLAEKLGTKTNHIGAEYIKAEDFDVDQVISVDDLLDDGDEDEIETEIHREEIVAEHPELFGVGFDVYEFESAKESNEKEKVASRTVMDDGNHPPESNVATITYYLTAANEIDTMRTEHF